MRILLIVVLSCSPIFSSCQGSKNRNIAKEMKQIYFEEFKFRYFQRMLLVGFNRSEEVKSVVFGDGSGFTEPIILDEDDALIDSLVANHNSKMIQDSIKRIGNVAEGAEGKHVFDIALSNYESRWFNKLAKKRSSLFIKKWKKGRWKY